MKEPLLTLLGRKTYVPSNVPELLGLLQLPPQHQQELQHALRELEQAGQVARIKGNRYVLPGEADLVSGRIRMNRQGKGFLIPDDPALKEIAIPESATDTALHEDRVLVRRDTPARPPRPGETAPATGTVLRVLERHRTRIVGTLQRGPRFLYVIPDEPRIPHDIYVPEPKDVGRKALAGDKVVVELRAWESRHTNPEGQVIEVLGRPDEEGVDMLSVLRQYNLPLHFSKKVLDEAHAIGGEVRPGELAGREDCRRHPVITIDPDDARDFDDAICLERLGDGHWKLWVHIADVSHYVKPGTELDDEARRRGNSTYLVDRVIPMLPEALSNELCSLKPNVDRLTKCVEFLIDDNGEVLKSRFYAAVIHSQRRFTYREAFAALQRPSASPIDEMLHQANALAQRIRRRRFKAGALELDFPEMKIRLDEQGRVDRIEKVENDISHQLIEEFMLLANEAVAARLLQLNRPAVHRVHEEPDPRRLQDYRDEVLSHHVPCGNLSHRAEVQKLLHRLGSLAIGPALKIGFLKSLMRARYALEPLGHYGLAKKHYAHFTSPIRRYADLVVHRALFEHGHGSKHSLKETADHISITERNSADAERDSKDVKLHAFLTAQLKSAHRPSYPALVTDLRNFGFFVDVTGLGMSGLVPFSALTDDFYTYDVSRLQVVGRRTRRVIKLGDRLEVEVARVDRFKKQVDFRLAQGAPAPSGRPARPASSQRPGPERALRASHSGRPMLSTGRPREIGRSPRRAGLPARSSREGQGPTERVVQSRGRSGAGGHTQGRGQRPRQGQPGQQGQHPSQSPRQDQRRRQGRDSERSHGRHQSPSQAQGRAQGQSQRPGQRQNPDQGPSHDSSRGQDRGFSQRPGQGQRRSENPGTDRNQDRRPKRAPRRDESQGHNRSQGRGPSQRPSQGPGPSQERRPSSMETRRFAANRPQPSRPRRQPSRSHPANPPRGRGEPPAR